MNWLKQFKINCVGSEQMCSLCTGAQWPTDLCNPEETFDDNKRVCWIFEWKTIHTGKTKTSVFASLYKQIQHRSAVTLLETGH